MTREEAEEAIRALEEATRANLAGKYASTLIVSRTSLPPAEMDKAVQGFIYSAIGGVRDALVLTFGPEGAQKYLAQAEAVLGAKKGNGGGN